MEKLEKTVEKYHGEKDFCTTLWAFGSYKTGANQSFVVEKWGKSWKGMFFQYKTGANIEKPANDNQNIEKCAKYFVKW